MLKSNSKKVLVILGPTATGKTDLAIQLAKKFDGVLIAADSRQVYKSLDIGTGKYSPGDKFKKFVGCWLLNDVWIHGYDLVEPTQQFTAAHYHRLVYTTVRSVWGKGKLPILVGGTGFYIKAALQGFETFGISPDYKLRKKLEKRTPTQLFNKLLEVNPKKAESLSSSDKKNSRRLIRAIEVAQFLKSHPGPLQPNKGYEVDVLKIGLNCQREVLYDRIDKRIDNWFEIGFVKEVARVIKKFGPNAVGLTSLGYQQVAEYLNGKYSQNTAKQKVKFAHHDFARRQLTWFRKDQDIIWFDITDKNYNLQVEKIVAKWLNKDVNGK